MQVAPIPPESPATAALSWHALDAGEVERRLGSGPHGLSAAEVEARRLRHGANEIEPAPPTSALVLVLHQFTSPLIYILVAAGMVTLLLGHHVDAAVIAAVLILNATIGFVQERKAEDAVRALQRLVSPHARVIRDGREWEIESRDLVPGDVVLLESGIRVPADVRLVSTTELRVDESLLTGESVPVDKRPAPVAAEAPLADRSSMAWAGTIVVAGRARGVVVATGAATGLGAIAESMRSEVAAETPLQQRMGRFARLIGLAVGVAVVVAFGIGLARGESLADMVLVAVGLAVAAVPEGLPVVFTITLALGVSRMSRRNAIIRRLPVVETLGSTTVIGSDKTGTLTENRMAVREIFAGGRRVALDGPVEQMLAENRAFARALVAGVLANEADLYRTGAEIETRGDPTEAALLLAAAAVGLEPAEVRGEYAAVAEVPFESERRYSASLRARDGHRVLFLKGAPERVLEMATQAATPDGIGPCDRDAIAAEADAMASRGLRVLATAMREIGPGEDEEAALHPGDLVFLGLHGMIDPPRAGVREAIAGCREAGIRVVMITGDHAGTARAIGAELGVAPADGRVCTGTDLDRLDDAALRERLREVSVFARVAPEHKLRVVRALQERGDVVAVTGDGVNDAPALKAADIGIAMGKSGTDVAREAADMVLADDNFVSIYAAVEEGRVTFDNVRKVTLFLMSTGVAAVFTLLASLAMGWPLPLLPAQLLWLNLVTNGLQDVALAFEPGERDVLRKPPRRRDEGILGWLHWERAFLAGSAVTIGTLVLFRWELDRGGSLVQAQTVALTTMVLFQNFHVGNCRSEVQSVFRRSPFSNPWLLAAAATAVAVHVGALHWGPMQLVLRVEPIEPEAWVRIVLMATSIVAVVEVHKLVRRGGAVGHPRADRESPGTTET